MERDVRLATASRQDLLLVIAQQRATISRLEALVAQQQGQLAAQQATIADLESRLADLESRLGPGPGTPKGMPGHKPQQAPAPGVADQPPRKQRSQAFVRRRSSTPDEVVEHAVERCEHCNTALAGGWLKRRRQVMELTLAPVRVVEHRYWERECALCRRRSTPKVDLRGVVAGKARLGVNLVSLIATLREQGRLPLESIQWYLETFHRLKLSVGALVGVLTRVARTGPAEVGRILERIRGSPAVHGDETGWRENGRNGYVWSFSTPQDRYFLHGRRTGEMVDRVLGENFGGVLVTDFYAAYNHYPGLHQRCWVHLLRDIHELKRQHPKDAGVRRWARTIHRLYRVAKQFRHPEPQERRRMRERLERALLAVVAPFAQDQGAPQRVLSQRIVQFIAELFVFVEHPEVPSDNNAAERSLRHLVTERKISGGTRSPEGTATKMTLSTLFGTWRVRGLNPFDACRQLLISPQA